MQRLAARLALSQQQPVALRGGALHRDPRGDPAGAPAELLVVLYRRAR
ncbi:MAG: hypothetical protein IPG96_08085 [Proteobacteria bacterium]|nr:hypothetical protein [Pseudomonadota bacterium]